MRIEHCTSHPGTRLVALACAVAFAAVAPAAEPPGAETDAGPEQRARVLEEQAAELAIRILRAQAHLADLEEALGGPASVPPRVGIPDLRDGTSVEQALAGLEHETGALERVLDSRRGEGGPAIAEEWSSAALLQHPGDRGLFRDDAGHRAALLRLADSLRDLRLWAEARVLYERLSTPPSPEAAIALTRSMECGIRLGDHARVVDAFVRARRTWGIPGSTRTGPLLPPEAFYLAGAAAFRRTDLPPQARDRDALPILQAVPEPFDVAAAYHRGALFARAGALDRARQEFEECDRLPARTQRQREQQEMCWLALGRIDGQRWPWDAERYWYAQLTPGFPYMQDALYEQASNLHWAGVDAEALRVVDRMAPADPDSPLAWDTDLLRAGILTGLGRHAEAMTAYDRIRRQATVLRDRLDEALRARREPAAWLALFTDGQGRGGPSPAVPPPAIQAAGSSAEVVRAVGIWGLVELSGQSLARGLAASDRLDAALVRDAGVPPPMLGASWASALGAAARELEVPAAAVEKAIRGNADSPDLLTVDRRQRLRQATGIRSRLASLQARASRDDRRIAALPGRGARPRELSEEQENLAGARRQLESLRSEAQEVLGLRVHQALLDVRARMDRVVLESDRGFVEVALARTQDAERRVEVLVFRSRMEPLISGQGDRSAAVDAIEARKREAGAEARRVREEAIGQLQEYVRRHEDDPVYTPRVLSRLAELQVVAADPSQAKAPGRPRPTARLLDDSGLEVTSDGCQNVVALHRRVSQGFPSYRQKDAVYFLAGYCLGEMGKGAEARQAYLDLVEKYPDSPHVPEAWIRIGNVAFEDGRPESLRSALEAYGKATGSGDHALQAHAAYMQGWTRYRLDDFQGAVETLVGVLDRQAAAGADPGGEVSLSAAQLLGAVLADPRWDGVAATRTAFAGGKGRSYEATVSRRLADELYEQGRYAQAVEAYRIAIARDPWAQEAPRIQERIVLAWNREGRSKEEAEERERLIATYDESSEWARRRRAAGESTEEARALVEASRTGAASSLHARARELERAGKQAAAVAEYRRAAQAYAAILLATPGAKGADTLALARAECTFGAGEYEAAARMFDAARDASGDPRHQAEAARSAVRSWEAEVARLKTAGALAARGPPMPPALGSLVASTDALVARFPGDALAPGAAYRAAEVVHVYGDPAEARRRLEEVAVRWPGSDAGKRSTRVVVESDLARRFDLGSEQLARKSWTECAATFRGIADGAPRHALADRSLYNAAICEEADHHAQEASALLGRLVAEHAASPLAPEALFRQASIDEAASEFAKAAERYQLLLERYPGAKQAKDALYNRARLLEILQRYEEAGIAFERFASIGPPAEAPATLLHASEVFEKGAAWPHVVRTVQAYQRKRPPAGDPEQLVVSWVRLGRAEAARGRTDAARAAWTRAVSEFSSRKLDPATAPVASPAVAEARFRLAEREIPRIERAALPATSSPARLEKALKALLADVGKVSSQYEEVKRLGSPEWTVAALYRQGWLAARFARILEEAPVPPELAKAGSEQDLAAYRSQIQELARPYGEQAVEACTAATRIAREHRVDTEWSRKAAELLEQERQRPSRAGRAG